jgi:membrane dipeptidase
MAELDAYMAQMSHTFPPGLGYELGARFVPPEQIEDIVAVLQGMGWHDDDLQLLLGGNLMRLARQVWKQPAHPEHSAEGSAHG